MGERTWPGMTVPSLSVTFNRFTTMPRQSVLLTCQCESGGKRTVIVGGYMFRRCLAACESCYATHVHSPNIYVHTRSNPHAPEHVHFEIVSRGAASPDTVATFRAWSVPMHAHAYTDATGWSSFGTSDYGNKPLSVATSI